MKWKVEIDENILIDIIAKHLKESYEELLSLTQKGYFDSKKDLKALKRVAKYYGAQIE